MAVIVGIVLPTTIARAESQSSLLLPITMALAIAGSAAEVQAAAPQHPFNNLAAPPPPRRLQFLPRRLVIPDGYALDDDRDPPMFAAPVNRDRLVALDLVDDPRHHMSASLAFDEESHHPLGHTDDVMRFVVDFRF